MTYQVMRCFGSRTPRHAEARVGSASACRPSAGAHPLAPAPRSCCEGLATLILARGDRVE